MTAAMRKPPTTRNTVMPMSSAKPISVSSTQPLFSMASGSARKVFCTKPPKVAMAHTATKSTKKLMPSAMRAPGLTGVKGFMRDLLRGVGVAGAAAAAAPRAALRLIG
jgi:hypothetical protein